MLLACYFVVTPCNKKAGHSWKPFNVASPLGNHINSRCHVRLLHRNVILNTLKSYAKLSISRGASQSLAK